MKPKTNDEKADKGCYRWFVENLKGDMLYEHGHVSTLADARRETCGIMSIAPSKMRLVIFREFLDKSHRVKWVRAYDSNR